MFRECNRLTWPLVQSMRHRSEREASDWREAFTPHTHIHTHTHTHSCWFPLTVNALFSATEGTCHFSSHTRDEVWNTQRWSTHRKLDPLVQRSDFEKSYQNSSLQALMQIIESFPNRTLTLHLYIRVSCSMNDMSVWCSNSKTSFNQGY